MARKEKSTLDFIQLDCVDKTTMKRLNRKFGKEGRLFWIDLLRLLGRTEWYILDLSDNEILEDIMIDELDIEVDKGLEIINQLAKWGNICKETWENHKNIWCQKLIDRHIEVFNKRKKIPVNNLIPVISVPETIISVPEIQVSVPEIQQSKVKESKGNENKENKHIEIEDAFLNLICNYFSQTTKNLKEKAWSFLNHLKNKKELEEFKKQTTAYIQFKKISEEKVHGWLGYQAEWKSQDWVNKLSKVEIKRKNNNPIVIN